MSLLVQLVKELLLLVHSHALPDLKLGVLESTGAGELFDRVDALVVVEPVRGVWVSSPCSRGVTWEILRIEDDLLIPLSSTV